MKAALAHAAEHVRFVFVSVDPERDSPQQLKRYLAIFDESFIGLTGTPKYLPGCGTITASPSNEWINQVRRVIIG